MFAAGRRSVGAASRGVARARAAPAAVSPRLPTTGALAIFGEAPPMRHPLDALPPPKRGESVSLKGYAWAHDGRKGFYEHQPGFLRARVRC